MPPSLQERLQRQLGAAYRLDRELTGGGMSRVFVAHEPALKRDVVVKVLPPDLVTSSSVSRFEREIEVTAQLQHPHILPIITAGGEGDLFYYITPYIRGESLKDRLTKDGKLPFDEGVRMIGEILGAIAFAHARGVVHRDIKPGNILLSEGHAILADFGIARALAGPDDGQVTMSGTLIGTPAYMAPENPRDEKADLYAVAVVAYEMLAGQRPRVKGEGKRSTEELAVAVGNREAGRARAVGEVLAKATAMDAEQRYGSARELRDALDAAATRRTTGRLVALAAAVVIVVGAIAAPRVYRELAPLPSGYVDRVAVLPIRSQSEPTVSLEAAALTNSVRASLGQWVGVTVVSDLSLGDRGSANPGNTPGDLARALSRRDAPTVVLSAELSGPAEARLLTVQAHAPDGSLIRAQSMRVSGLSTLHISRQAANVAIRHSETLPWRDDEESFPALRDSWRASDSAEVRLRQHDMASARTLFTLAATLDSNNLSARFRRALLASWDSVSAGQAELNQAWQEIAPRTSRMPDETRAQATAWLALRARDFARACRLFDSLAHAGQEPHSALVGLGDCRRLDDAIVHVRGQLAFRSGWHSAATAYERALERWPGTAPPFLFQRLSSVLLYQPNRVRVGSQVGSSTSYAAMPSLVNDTVSYEPQAVGAVPLRSTRSTSEAVLRNGSRLRVAVQRWLVERPDDAEAHLLHAEILEAAGALEGPATGERSALSEARMATRLAGPVLERVRGRATTVRILLKLRRWADTRAEADSALALFDESNAALADALAPLAALRGDEGLLRRAKRVAGALPNRVDMVADGTYPALPAALAQLQADVAAAFILGRCDATSTNLLRDFTDQLEAFESDRDRRKRLRQALVQPIAELAAPCVGYARFAEHVGSLGIQEAERAVARGDSSIARARAIESLNSIQAGGRRTSTDFALRWAWVSLAAGDTTTALTRLDHLLAGLISASPLLVTRDVDAASLVRIMRQTSDLHARREGANSYDALRWLAAADTLTRRR
jgi:hypothetical protein